MEVILMSAKAKEWKGMKEKERDRGGDRLRE